MFGSDENLEVPQMGDPGGRESPIHTRNLAEIGKV